MRARQFSVWDTLIVITISSISFAILRAASDWEKHLWVQVMLPAAIELSLVAAIINTLVSERHRAFSAAYASVILIQVWWTTQSNFDPAAILMYLNGQLDAPVFVPSDGLLESVRVYHMLLQQIVWVYVALMAAFITRIAAPHGRRD
jgi:hypothetical protein